MLVAGTGGDGRSREDTMLDHSPSRSSGVFVGGLGKGELVLRLYTCVHVRLCKPKYRNASRLYLQYPKALSTSLTVFAVC